MFGLTIKLEPGTPSSSVKIVKGFKEVLLKHAIFSLRQHRNIKNTPVCLSQSCGGLNFVASAARVAIMFVIEVSHCLTNDGVKSQ